MNTLKHFLLLSVMPLSQERILGQPYLRLDQKFLSWLAEYYYVIRGPPFLVLSRAPATVNWCVLTVLGSLLLSSDLEVLVCSEQNAYQSQG